MEFRSFDGTRLVYQTMGAGVPLLLLHGLFSTAETNWVRYGTAARLVDAGYRLIMPDHRGHGASESPDDPERWPEDVLARDAEALIAQLGPGDELVLAGYSLGARTVVRLLARGLRPRAAIIAGMGLDGILDTGPRSDWFIRMIRGRGGWDKGSGEYLAERFMSATVPSPDNLVHLLQRQLATPLEILAGFELPVLVVNGRDDADNGRGADLAAALPDARFVEIPGNHMASVTRPELAAAMIDFLDRL